MKSNLYYATIKSLKKGGTEGYSEKTPKEVIHWYDEIIENIKKNIKIEDENYTGLEIRWNRRIRNQKTLQIMFKLRKTTKNIGQEGQKNGNNNT